jgi:hypothetical protein
MLRIVKNGLGRTWASPARHVAVGIDLAKTNDFTVLYGARMPRDRRNCWFERFNSVSWPEQKRRVRRACGRC